MASCKVTDLTHVKLQDNAKTVKGQRQRCANCNNDRSQSQVFVSGELLIADDICSDLKEKKINLFFYMRILAVIKQLFSFNVFLVSFSDLFIIVCMIKSQFGSVLQYCTCTRLSCNKTLQWKSGYYTESKTEASKCCQVVISAVVLKNVTLKTKIQFVSKQRKKQQHTLS